MSIPIRHAQAPRRRGARLGLALLLAAIFTAGSIGSAAWAFWSAGATVGSNGASAATSVNGGQTPTATVAAANVTVSWAASTLASGQPVSGYTIKRYDATGTVLQTIKSACTGTIATTSCVESAVPEGSWKYSVTPVLATNWLGAESAKSATVIVDTVVPTNNITLSSVTGAAIQSGNTIYYKGSAAGSFKLTNAVADAGSGPASSQTTALTGGAAGWTHTASTVSGASPYVSNVFSWAAGTTSGPGEAVTGRDVVGNTATTTLTFTNDSTGPTGGSISYLNGDTTGPSVSVTFGAGTDAGSGLGTGLLQRASTPISNGSCGTAYGAFATVATNPTSPLVDATTPGNCYKYQYVVADALGNTSTTTSASVAATHRGAYYRFEEGVGTTAADSLNGYTATLQAGAGWSTPGKTGASALNLTGANNSWAKYTGPVIDTSQSYTVGTWVKLNNLSGFQTFASIDGTTISPFYLQLNGGVFDFAQRGSDSTGATLAQVNGLTPSIGVWYYVVGVYDKSAGTIQLYVNGVSQGTATAAAVWQATGATTIGRAKWGGASVDFVNGVLDETRFYDRALTASEITTLAGYGNLVRNTPGLLSYWRLDDASGATMDDITATNNNGTYVNGPTLSVPGAIASDSDTAVQFNGSSTYATATRQISGDFTIEFWFKSTQSYSSSTPCDQWWRGAGLVDADTPGAGNDFGIGLCLGQVVAGIGGGDTSVVSSSTYNNGAWHHVAFTRVQSSGAMQLYVDGVSVGTATGSTAALTTTTTMNIGRSADGGNYFAGTIDELAMYTTVLSGATISSHYALAQ
ncbi:MAG: LamG domain-containing protein [Pseudolysinimonas sp.]